MFATRLGTCVVLAGVATAVAGCGATSTASTAPTPTHSSTPTPRPHCPNGDGGDCLGRLAAGTYTTVTFHPRLTYTVPAGWSNFEDLPGNFLLVPPGGTLSGVNDNTSDFVGVYASIAADAADCSGKLEPGVGLSASAITTWISHHPGIAATNVRPITVGGLQGSVLDITLAPGWTKACPYSNGQPVVPVIVGVGSSSLDHAITGTTKTRLYLLNSGTATLVIEVDDVSGGGHLQTYSNLVEAMQFAAA